jgi:hypothetical protein
MAALGCFSPNEAQGATGRLVRQTLINMQADTQPIPSAPLTVFGADGSGTESITVKRPDRNRRLQSTMLNDIER